jgi:Xaa-Pro dipeptidase|tara:strand:+ start:797 stop:1942 length:1146 start_codon:yes stop_codon:yes gene_type:complete
MFEKRMKEFREKLLVTDIKVALITDEDSVYYLSGYYDYLHMEFGRPTILVVPKDGDTFLVTPAIDLNTATEHARVDRISAWNDGMGSEWREDLSSIARGSGRVGIEVGHMPALVRSYVSELVGQEKIITITPILSEMRMIKSDQELQLARHAGQVANAMMNAGRRAIAANIPEFEVAIATSEAGTRKAAELLSANYGDKDMSPNTHFLQIMASGDKITQTHHRASTRIMQYGEPVFLCFCGMTNFHRFKLGFDRTFWIGEIGDKSQLEVYEVAVASQTAALNALRAGVTAESIHLEYAEVIQSAGYEYPFRCGRATGFSFLEGPELVTGDKTILRPGMVLAVDGSVSVETFRAQVGDSFIITEDGYETLTHHSKALEDIIL